MNSKGQRPCLRQGRLLLLKLRSLQKEDFEERKATTNVYSDPKSCCHHDRPAFGKVPLGAVVCLLASCSLSKIFSFFNKQLVTIVNCVSYCRPIF